MADAGYRLTVEGEREFKKALAEINAQVKASKSEMKALAAEYDITDDKLGNLQQRQNALTDTMGKQADKVKLLEDKYRSMAEELGENDTAVLRVKESLNKAREELAKSTAAWQENQEKLDQYGASAESVDNSLAKIDAAISANQSELKLLSAQYGDAKDKTQSYAKQNEVLGDSINQQKKKIELLTDALQKAEKEFGEGSAEVLGYKKQIADANTELLEMEGQLKENNAALQNGGKAASPLKEALLDVSNKLGIDIPPGIESMSTAFVGAAAAAGGIALAVKSGIETMKEMAAYADDVLTESVITGIDTQVYQQLKYMDGLMDVSTETISASLQKLKRAMDDAANGSKELDGRFRSLGVEIKDANGELRDSWDVYLDVVDALGDMTNETERDAAAMDLMGKSAADLNPLIEAGADRMQELADEAERVGYVLSDEQLMAAGEFQDLLDRLDKQTEAVKNNIGQVLIESMHLVNGNASIDEVNSAWKGLEKTVFGLIDTIKGDESGTAAEEYGTLGRWLFGWSNVGQIVKTAKSIFQKVYDVFHPNYENEVEIIEVDKAVEDMETLEKAAEEAAEAIESIGEKAEEYATTQVEKMAEAAEKAYEKEIKAAQKAADQRVKDYEKSLDKEMDALESRHEAELKAVEKNNAALLKSFQKSQKERQKALEESLDAEMKALEDQHKEKLALIDEEYNARLKLLDEDQRKQITEIDDEIAAIEAVTAAEEQAREEQKRQEEIAALEKAVSEAESREEKEKAESELSEYLLDLERERILAEREAQIAALEDRKELLEQEFDAKREEIEAEKTAAIEGLETEFEEEKLLLEEQHQKRREMLEDTLSEELDIYRENLNNRVTELKKEQSEEKTVLQESISERVQNFKDKIQEEVDAEKEKAAERLTIAKQNAEDMTVVWEDYYKRVKSLMDQSASDAAAAGQAMGNGFAGALAAAMLAQEENVSYAAGRLTRGALMQGMESGDVPTVTGAANYTAAVAEQLTKASGALAAGSGVANTYNITISASDVQEFNDIVRIAQAETVDTRMGYVRR